VNQISEKRSKAVSLLRRREVFLAAIVVLAIVRVGPVSVGQSSEGCLQICLDLPPLQRGCEYGRQIRSLVAHNVQVVYLSAGAYGYSCKELARLADQWVQRLEANYPSFVEEMKGVAIGSGCRQEDIFALNYWANIVLHEECTTFVASSSATATGRTFVFKNRDTERDVKNVLILATSGGSASRFRFMAVGPAGSVSVSHGINDKGLAIANNALYLATEYERQAIVGNLIVMRLVLENCARVDEAVSYIRGTKGKGASCYLIGDPEKSAVMEVAGDWESADITATSFIAHTNHYLFDRTRKYDAGYSATSSTALRLNSANRFLNSIIDAGRKITLADVFRLARNHENSPKSVCTSCTSDSFGTVSAALFEIDPEFPSKVSTFWNCMGQPCVMPFVSLVIGECKYSSETLADWISGRLWDSGNLLRRETYGTLKQSFPNLARIWQDSLSAIEGAEIDMMDTFLTDAKATLRGRSPSGDGVMAKALSSLAAMKNARAQLMSSLTTVSSSVPTSSISAMTMILDATQQGLAFTASNLFLVTELAAFKSAKQVLLGSQVISTTASGMTTTVTSVPPSMAPNVAIMCAVAGTVILAVAMLLLLKRSKRTQK